MSTHKIGDRFIYDGRLYEVVSVMPVLTKGSAGRSVEVKVEGHCLGLRRVDENANADETTVIAKDTIPPGPGKCQYRDALLVANRRRHEAEAGAAALREALEESSDDLESLRTEGLCGGDGGGPCDKELDKKIKRNNAALASTAGAALLERLAKAERSYVPQDIAAECLDALAFAGCGGEGKANTLWAMVREIIESRDALRAEVERLKDCHGDLPSPNCGCASCSAYAYDAMERRAEKLEARVAELEAGLRVMLGCKENDCDCCNGRPLPLPCEEDFASIRALLTQTKEPQDTTRDE